MKRHNRGEIFAVEMTVNQELWIGSTFAKLTTRIHGRMNTMFVGMIGEYEKKYHLKSIGQRCYAWLIMLSGL